jgi:hypothetical protein
MQIAKCKLQIGGVRGAHGERGGCKMALGGASASSWVCATRSDRHPCQEKCACGAPNVGRFT